MAVFQVTVPVDLRYGYDHFKLLEGQLVTANEPKLLHFLSNHVNFREITDDTLIKLAPPLYMIKPVQDVHTMRKEDIITELRSYGIRVDPYTFSSQLSMQLDLARKLKKRNFLTVLNSQGKPVYIDRVNLPVPIITKNDSTLSEPEEPKGDFFKISEYLPEKEDNYKKIKEKEDQKLHKNEALMITKTFDENEINEGQDFVEFCTKYNEEKTEEFKAQIEREKVTQELLWKVQEYIVPEVVKDIERLVDNSQIIPENFTFLTELSGGKFMLFPIEEVDKDYLRGFHVISRYSIDALETYLRHHGIRIEYEYSDPLKHRTIGQAVKEVVSKYEGKEKEWQIICINMLQKRIDEIEKNEPDYRSCTLQSLRRQCAKCIPYGMNVEHAKIKDQKELMTYTTRVFQFLKLGLHIPSKEKMTETLLYYRRHKRLDQDHPLNPSNSSAKKRKFINNGDGTEEPKDV